MQKVSAWRHLTAEMQKRENDGSRNAAAGGCGGENRPQ